jgi:NAD-dependent SIR2 family protein deacetylase
MKIDTAEIVKKVTAAEAIFIGAGAGMGVDSGLPDFRGSQGFWRAYPPLAKLGLQFEDMADPRWFSDNPKLAWGFYGHRFQLYNNSRPHQGYLILKKWCKNLNIPSFVFTSNVDGHFTQAGWTDQVVECHGSLMVLQCLKNCGQTIWSTHSSSVKDMEVCMKTITCQSELPRCPSCNALARPNILMFSDFFWDPHTLIKQEKTLENWLSQNGNKKLLVIEIGAGLKIPTVRSFCERVKRIYDCEMIRINPRDYQSPKGVSSMPLGALEALGLINSAITNSE